MTLTITFDLAIVHFPVHILGHIAIECVSGHYIRGDGPSEKQIIMMSRVSRMF